jgi:hypothetical protein
MLRGLPGSDTSQRLSEETLLASIPSTYHLFGPSIFGMDPPTPSSGLAPRQVLHVFQLAYLNEMQQCICMNA